MTTGEVRGNPVCNGRRLVAKNYDQREVRQRLPVYVKIIGPMSEWGFGGRR
jgi:hypothetical protein